MQSVQRHQNNRFVTSLPKLYLCSQNLCLHDCQVNFVGTIIRIKHYCIYIYIYTSCFIAYLGISLFSYRISSYMCLMYNIYLYQIYHAYQFKLQTVRGKKNSNRTYYLTRLPITSLKQKLYRYLSIIRYSQAHTDTIMSNPFLYSIHYHYSRGSLRSLCIHTYIHTYIYMYGKLGSLL